MDDTKERPPDASEAPSTKESINSHPNSVPPDQTNEAVDDHDEPVVYPGTAKLILILSAAALSIFLVALDTSIISTAIPQITDDFHSLDDVAW